MYNEKVQRVIQGTYLDILPLDLKKLILNQFFLAQCHYCGIDFFNTYNKTVYNEEYVQINVVEYWNACPMCEYT